MGSGAPSGGVQGQSKASVQGVRDSEGETPETDDVVVSESLKH